MDDADGGRGVNGSEDAGDPTTWADLFGRAAPHEVDEAAVREALARRRERTDE
jgi:hypothetical protein